MVSGAVERTAPSPSRPLSLRRIFRSLGSKLVLLMIVFLAVPVILYNEFRQADEEQQTLLMESVREQGRLIAQSLRPLLERQGPSPLLNLNEEVSRFAAPQTGVKVLYRPAGEVGVSGFYFVASEPPVPPSQLDEEKNRLIERGVFDNLAQSCWGELSMALRHRKSTGEEELLTSITPITTDSGCWAVITTHSTLEFLGTAIGQPYWKTLEVRLAAGIYFGMAFFTIVLFITIWRGLMSFGELARNIRTGRAGNVSFAVRNKVPELAVVAEEFDRMTSALQESAESIRLAAEDNAHAFKTPIAIMRQSLEPLRRLMPPDAPRGQRALDVVEVSLDRLDHLVTYARRLEETTAELLDPPRQRVELSRLVERMLSAYVDTCASQRITIDSRLEPKIAVLASEDLLETVFENLIDNAIEVSPKGSRIVVELKARQDVAELVLKDEGPGVPHSELARIFERYVSLGPKGGDGQGLPDHASDENSPIMPHYGIGLWIVRRNVQAVGGTIRAENRPEGGLAMILRLPLV
jgi:two-component system sensor histidine kinase ChvG